VINSERPAHVAITSLIHRYAELGTFACTDGVWSFASRRYVEPAAGDASEHLVQPLATRH